MNASNALICHLGDGVVDLGVRHAAPNAEVCDVGFCSSEEFVRGLVHVRLERQRVVHSPCLIEGVPCVIAWKL